MFESGLAAVTRAKVASSAKIVFKFSPSDNLGRTEISAGSAAWSDSRGVELWDWPQDDEDPIETTKEIKNKKSLFTFMCPQKLFQSVK